MSAVIAVLLGVVVLAGVVHDTARLITPFESRCPPLARLRGRRAALEATERWTTGLLLHGRITPADYRSRMSRLAHGERHPGPTRHPRHPRHPSTPRGDRHG
ncbi:hypothetical protein [Streptomyces poonensis]|uniref:Uncharacterized protein n=1 Tax=Streptomyces poonensis TaxID=68255 RepID=A0A918UV34_9ACTN|nr:hypothetical protein [Streptomyces poonensis]GGZ35219.1 hypothetical protein GCM10010365_65060 [Streptomyces poonensis]GLJ89567.1 hypothetical protein GCM10017589_21670 [Streptomyces poonensis]